MKINTVILFGSTPKENLKENLIKLLSCKFGVNIFEDSCLSFLGNNQGDTVNFIVTSHMKFIDTKNAIIIIGSNAKLNMIKSIDKSCCVILQSENFKQIKQLSNFGVKIFTCGFGSKDYITFSSRNNENAIISLQRSIKFSLKHTCEPFEILCVMKTDTSDYSILASVLCSILLKGLCEENIDEIRSISFA